MAKLYMHTLKEYFASIENKSYIESYLINPKLSKWDFIIFLFLLCLLIILRLLFSGIRVKGSKDNIICKISENSIFNIINKKWDISKEDKLSKWKENLWFGLWHTFSFLCNFIILLNMSGYLNNTNGWVKMFLKEPTGKWLFLVTEDEYNQNKRGWPFMYTNNFVHYFYLLQISYWSSCLFYLHYETRRKDFYVFVLHHISTITLLVYSHFLNFWRVGIVILFIHDIVDISLYFSKLLSYSKKNVKMALNIFYFSLVFSYFFFRILFYFHYIVLPLSNVKLIRSYTDGFISTHYDVPGCMVLITFIWALMIMHCYWFILIIKMSHIFISKILKNEIVTDLRSEDENDNVPTIESTKKRN